MSVWGTVIGAAAALLSSGTAGAVGAVGGALSRGRALIKQRLDGAERRQVAFTVAAIALAAKMAAADGVATPAEFATFERLFRLPEAERVNAARFYRLAQGSVAGFEAYADQAARMLGHGSPMLEDLLEALLLIAKIDGIHQAELDYLDAVAPRLGIEAAAYAQIRARHLAGATDDPWLVLGVAPGSSLDTVHAAYRSQAKLHHPDRHIAEGTPPEFIRVAEERMAAINAAYAVLRAALTA